MANLTAEVQLVEGTTSLAASRAHSVAVDRPTEAGGSDLGFLGGELLLAGQGGCFLSNLVAAARSRGHELRRVKVDVLGETETAPARFARILVHVTIQESSPLTHDEAQHLMVLAQRSCIVTNTLRMGTPVEIDLQDPPLDTP